MTRPRPLFLAFLAVALAPSTGCFDDPAPVGAGQVCDADPCFGCTVPAASNYNPLADVDDGTCECTAKGNPVVDQSQLESDAGGGGLDEWQSFTVGIGGGLARLTIELGSPLDPQPSPATLEIYAGEGVGGMRLATTEVTLEPGLLKLQAFEFAEPVPLAAGEVYTFRLTVPEQTIGHISYGPGDAYPGGMHNGDPQRDLVFRTDMVQCE
ncbi:hypothetical protein [Enhygromyxa salina]|uniref:Lipoprotein n=1 Tax=Enhygromyxa salina TaxID=215803 RepID=A0A2S9XUN2_9BACT|nr:hypothetical protein [Enhygromyxa salina]PRP96421.1 hypothetical protein ENSA7_72360 [Enhygromyxa salina]